MRVIPVLLLAAVLAALACATGAAPTPSASQPAPSGSAAPADAFVLGRADAPVTLEEYADFQ